MNFNKLVESILFTHNVLQEEAVKAVNRNTTIRNWLIGFYIVHFEQNGDDRATYGSRLLQNLADSLGTEGYSYRNLKLFRQFYLEYNSIGNLAYPIIQSIPQIRQTASAQLELKSSPEKVGLSIDHVLNKLSFSHLVELLSIDDPLKRGFYEVEAINGNWSVRDLKRQINTLYFERMGLSKDLPKLSSYVNEGATRLTPKDIIQSPFTFEFLGLKAPDILFESDLEKALLEHLQGFILELGNGFCLEGRQKRLLIGDEYFFVDLVFYHRILKCHILIELKVDEFKHEYIGQLNSYVAYYKSEVMLPEDNPPVGILLVTNHNKTLVEYATAGLDTQLFVQKYLVELPSKEKLRDFIQSQI